MKRNIKLKTLPNIAVLFKDFDFGYHHCDEGPGKTTYVFSVTFHLACYQQAGRVWSGRKGTENMLALAENVYIVLPTPLR
jgi:hypothetical protein